MSGAELTRLEWKYPTSGQCGADKRKGDVKPKMVKPEYSRGGRANKKPEKYGCGKRGKESDSGEKDDKSTLISHVHANA